MHLTYGRDRCIRDSVVKEHLHLYRFNDALLTFKIHPYIANGAIYLTNPVKPLVQFRFHGMKVKVNPKCSLL